MNDQKLLPAPKKTLLLSDHFFHVPKLAADNQHIERLIKARIRGVVNGNNQIDFSSNARPFYERPFVVDEYDDANSGIPKHLRTISQHFNKAFVDGKKTFCVYYGENTRRLEYTAYDTPEDAFDGSVNIAYYMYKLILSFTTARDFSEQLNGKDGPYISPVHCVGRPIITKGTIREREQPSPDTCPPEYWYR